MIPPSSGGAEASRENRKTGAQFSNTVIANELGDEPILPIAFSRCIARHFRVLTDAKVLFPGRDFFAQFHLECAPTPLTAMIPLGVGPVGDNQRRWNLVDQSCLNAAR